MKNTINSFRDLVLNRKYGPLSLAHFRTQYESNEAINDHAKNVLLCAFFAGSNVDLYIARKLYTDQQKAGYLSPELMHERDQLMGRLKLPLLWRGAGFAVSWSAPVRSLALVFSNWHLWEGMNGRILLSNEDTKELNQFNDTDTAINYLWSIGQKEAARNFNQQIKARING